MKKSIIFLAFAIILIVNMTFCSAVLEVTKNIDVKKGDKLDFNNKKIDYNSIWDKYKPIKIVDNWGIPFLSSDKLEGYIDKHDESCGSSCSSSFVIKQYDDKALIEDVRFYTIKNDGSRILEDIKSYQFYIKTGENERTVDDYKWVCKENGKILLNGTKEVDCSYDKIGNHKEYDKIWKKINVGEVYPAGEYEIKLEGVKSEKRTVDWQIKSYVWLEDWAVWGSTTLRNDLLAYYKFDEGTGTKINDSLGRYNTNYSTAQYWQPGKINNSFRSDGLDADGSQTYINITGQQNMTVSFWINKSGSETDGGIFTFDNCGEAGEFGIYMTTDRINVCTQAQSLNGWTPRASIWEHYVVTVNSTTIASYVNGVYNESMAVSNFKFATSTGKPGFFLFIGGGGGGSSLENVGVDEIGIWNRTLTLADVQTLYNSGNGLPYSSLAAGVVTLNSPDNNAVYGKDTTVTFNCSAVLTGANIINFSLWDNSTGIWKLNKTNTNTGSNQTLFTQTYPFTNTNVLWNCQACDSDGDCGFASSNRSIKISKYIVNSTTYNATTYETSTETFVVNATGMSTATLIYNGTSYAATVSGDIATVSIGIPSSPGTKNFYWEFDSGSGTSSVYNQVVKAINWQQCNSTDPIPYLNFTFFDEVSLSPINNSIVFNNNISIGGSIYKNYLISATSTTSHNYSFCFSPSYLPINSSINLQYYSTGYFQRDYFNNILLTNSTTNLIFYSLGSGDGIYSTTTVTDSTGAVLEGADVKWERTINSTVVNVGEKLTDSMGQATFWLNPNQQHTLTIVKSGCTTKVLSITPISSYAVQLTCGNASTVVNYSQYQGVPYVIPTSTILDGLTYKRTPASGTILPTGITWFEYSVTSSLNPIVSARMEIVDSANGSILKSITKTVPDTLCNATTCYMNTSFYVPEGSRYKGKYYVNLGSGYYLLEGDANWRFINASYGNNTLVKSIKDFTNLFDTYNNIYTGEEYDAANRAEFSRIIFLFLIMTCCFAFFNKYVGGYDAPSVFASPGAFLVLMAIVILLGSMAGGTHPTVHYCGESAEYNFYTKNCTDGSIYETQVGYFYLVDMIPVNNVTLNSNGTGNAYMGIAEFVNNYIMAFYGLLIMIAYFFSVSRRNT